MMNMKKKTSLFYESSTSSSDEDDRKGQGSVRQHVDIPCKNSRCHQEILQVNNTEFYCSRECYHSKLERDRIGETGILLRRITINGRGGTGLLRNRDLVDHLVIKVDVVGRVVTVHNSSAAAARWKKKQAGKQSTEHKAREESFKYKRSDDDQRRLKELLNIDSGDTSEDSTDSADDVDNDPKEKREEAHEEIQTVLSYDVNSSICPVHTPVGKKGTRLKGYIIGIRSPWELYMQTEEMLIRIDEINKVLNRPEGIDPRLVLPLWLPTVGGHCTAKYEDELFRAKILEKVENSFRVKYIDYGNIDLVSRSDVFQLNPEVTLIPRQCFFFKLSNAKPRNKGTTWSQEVCEFMMEHLDGGIANLELESVERGVIHWGTVNVISSLSGKIVGDLGEILVENKFADADSFYL